MGRRSFLGVTAMSLVGPTKRIDAGVLRVGYADAGRAVIRLHGGPGNIESYADVDLLRAVAAPVRGMLGQARR